PKATPVLDPPMLNPTNAATTMPMTRRSSTMEDGRSEGCQSGLMNVVERHERPIYRQTATVLPGAEV
ncbi:MAG: hypothetical protein R3324_13305, partial [Halobacteriales archaeon]|nr:hypothetical protein [Halobacteriales archaeon]